MIITDTEKLERILSRVRGKGIDFHGGEQVDILSCLEDLIEWMRGNVWCYLNVQENNGSWQAIGCRLDGKMFYGNSDSPESAIANMKRKSVEE